MDEKFTLRDLLILYLQGTYNFYHLILYLHCVNYPNGSYCKKCNHLTLINLSGKIAPGCLYYRCMNSHCRQKASCIVNTPFVTTDTSILYKWFFVLYLMFEHSSTIIETIKSLLSLPHGDWIIARKKLIKKDLQSEDSLCLKLIEGIDLKVWKNINVYEICQKSLADKIVYI